MGTFTPHLPKRIKFPEKQLGEMLERTRAQQQRQRRGTDTLQRAHIEARARVHTR